MGLLNPISGPVNDLSNTIRNPFSASLTRTWDGPDFAGGFYIKELDSKGEPNGVVIRLIGNMMPKIPLKFGGDQRIKREYYAGRNEPVVQTMGGQESDITINGEFKAKRFSNPDLKDVAYDIMLAIDASRLRGNIVRIGFDGDVFYRYALIQKVDFDLLRLSRITYSITFLIIGFNFPTNANFLQTDKSFPFHINEDLINEAAEFQLANDNIPDSVPQSIGDVIKSVVNFVAQDVALVTGFVDGVLSTADDIRSAVNRGVGLVSHAQKTLGNYKRTVGALNHFDLNAPLGARYQQARYYTRNLSLAASMTRTLELLRARLKQLVNTLPLGRHMVRTGDTLQKIAQKFYGSPDNWKRIYEYNNLTTTDLATATILQIPRI